MVSPDEKYTILSSSLNGKLKSSGGISVYNSKTMTLMPTPALNNNTTTTRGMCFNHNGSMLATGGDDGYIRLFDTSFKGAIMEWNALEPIISLAFSFDEMSIISIGLHSHEVREWSLNKSGRLLRRRRIVPWQLGAMGGSRQILSGDICMDAENGTRAAVCIPGVVRACVLPFAHSEKPDGDFTVTSDDISWLAVGSCCVDWAGDTVATGVDDGCVYLCNV